MSREPCAHDWQSFGRPAEWEAFNSERGLHAIWLQNRVCRLCQAFSAEEVPAATGALATREDSEHSKSR